MMDKSSFWRAAVLAQENAPKPTALDRVIKMGCILMIWDDRYMSGFWIGVMPQSRKAVLETAKGFTESGDVEALGFSEFLMGSGQWLPLSIGTSIEDATSKLAEKLASLSFDTEPASNYWEAVEKAFDALESVSDGGYGIGVAIHNGLLPNSIEQALK